MAADHGHPDAQYNLAVYYMNGLGNVKKDEEMADEWIRISAGQGNQQALRILNSRQ